MTREEHEALVLNILANLSDQGQVSEMLNTLREDYSQQLTTVDTLTNEKTTLTTHNESLKNVNNKIMLQLGDFSSTLKDKKVEDKIEEKVEEPMKFEDLLNSEGEML